MKLVNYYEDISKVHVNTLPDRAYFIPFESEDKARHLLREDSKRMQLLNGSWKFVWYPNLESVPQDFYMETYETAELGNIDVPGCWQTQGYDHYHYVGAKHIISVDPPYVPADNPCGAYVLDFRFDIQESTPVTELVFEGVDSCFYVWMNGQFVGYSEVSHAISMFDVSEFLKDGMNRLAVLNMKWSTGTYFEIQDKWRMTGIFRDVYLLRRPTVRLEDFYVHQEIADDYSSVKLKTDLTVIGSGTMNARLFSPDGTLLGVQELEAETGQYVEFCVTAPELWSAESPALYTLTLNLGGESIAQKIGVRRISWEDGIIKVNGHPIRIKGVNRHDTDALTGYAVDRAHIVRDLTLMKQNNINAIRTAHYQNSPIVIELCNELGLYVMSEADHEIHGIAYSGGEMAPAAAMMPLPEKGGAGYRAYCPLINDDPCYELAALDRMTKNPKRDKNQSSVLFWSLGNESGWGRNQELAGKWIKEYDPTRLLHYENLFPGLDRTPDYSCLDVMSRMYPSIPWIEEKYGDRTDYDNSQDLIPNSDPATEAYYKERMKTSPFLLCEFIHAMGNSSGDAEDYFQLMERYDRFAGGFVWEWADHAKYIGEDREGKPMYQYGGDSGEFPTDENFCMDGLNFPDRRPHTSLREYKNVLRPIRARWAIPNQSVAFRNMLNVIDCSEAVYVMYHLTCNGEVRAEGRLDLPPCLPGQEVEVPINLTVPAKGECFLNLTYHNKKETAAIPSDFELGLDQLELDTEKPLVNPWLQPQTAVEDLTLHETDRVAVVSGRSSGGDFSYTFDKKLGVFRDLKINGVQLFERPMEFNISRAPTDNDRGFGRVYETWKELGYYDAVLRVYSCELEQQAQSIAIRTKFGMAAVSRGNALTAEAVWTVSADGMISLHCDVNRRKEFLYLPRFGIRLFLKQCPKVVDYFGYGPYESYIDKHHYCYRGLFHTNVDELFEDYARPQENGSHYWVQYMNVGKMESCGLQAVPEEKPFSFNVSRYTQEMLEQTPHNYELRPARATVVCLDYKQSGIGSNSCGPMLLEQYQLREERFAFGVRLLPRV